MDLLVAALRGAGFAAAKPNAGFFLYVPSPKSATVRATGTTIEFPTAESFCEWLIREELMSTVPWDDAGAFIRFSVTFQAAGPDAEQAVIGEIAARLGRYSFAF